MNRQVHRPVSYLHDKHSEGGGTAEQAERNYQLIENLMSRIQKMAAKAEERRKACEEDQKADSDMCSSKVTTLQQDIDDHNDEGPMQRRPSMFLRESENGGYEINVTFRSVPMTEAGKRLEALFEEEAGHLFSTTQKRNVKAKAISAATIGRSRRIDHKLDEKKQDRIKYERRLQSNLEHYVTRAVNELQYKLPDCAPLNDDDPTCAKSGSRMKPLRAELWPIPLDVQMNPRLLLAYACERIVLPSGVRMFKHFALCRISCKLYIYLYWFVHCRFFQDNSNAEQYHLLRCVATLYVKMLSLRALQTHRDFFFKYYPYVMANAIFYGFYYLCPGSRHLYTVSFKKILFLQLAQILTGMDVCASSVNVLRQQCFPEDAADDQIEKDADSLPPLPMHSANNVEMDGLGHRNVDANNAPTRGPEDNGSSTLQSSMSASLLASRSKPEFLERQYSTPMLSRSSAIAGYIGSRADLRFRPSVPADLKAVLPRQRKVAFDSFQVSPLLQEYLSTNPKKILCRMHRTVPVHWCFTGGTETFVKTTNSKETHECIQASYRESKQSLRRDLSELQHTYKKQLRHLDREKKRIQEGGAVTIGRFALDRVVASSA